MYNYVTCTCTFIYIVYTLLHLESSSQRESQGCCCSSTEHSEQVRVQTAGKSQLAAWCTERERQSFCKTPAPSPNVPYVTILHFLFRRENLATCTP